MDYALISSVIHVGEKREPIFRHILNGHGKTVILGCHEAAPSPGMQTRLIVATIAVSMINLVKIELICMT
jgi:hypothetical protein